MMERVSAQTSPVSDPRDRSADEGPDAVRGLEELDLPRPGLLIVDDETPILAAIRRTLRAEPYTIHTAESGREGLRILEQHRIGVVISDYKMREMDGVQFLNIVRSRFPEIQRIMLTGQADQSAIQDVINQAQIFRFISKPWDPQALILTISASFDQYRVLRENERLWQITERQNRELRELNHSLEQRIERRTAQLGRAKIEWERTFDAIVDPVAIVSHRYEVVRANLAYAAKASVEIRDVPGKRCFEILAGRSAPCVGCPLARALLGEAPRGVDIAATNDRTLHVWAYPLRPVSTDATSDPNLPPVSLSGEMAALTEDITSNLPEIGVEPGQAAVCYYRDVTDERALATELARTQKLASLGLFVGGVAHEINNPIGGILAFTQLLLRQGNGESIDPVLKDIESSALRCKRIIESLLSFAQGSQHLRRSSVEIDELVREAVASFERDYLKGGLTVELEIGTRERVEVDPALIHQLLRNLLQNAEHATVGPGGLIRVSVEPQGSMLAIEVTDRGRGIPEAQLSKIFDPFYTTKTDGRGTGLGLSICHRIVEQHSGSLDVRSKVGEGTTVRVLLPRVPDGTPSVPGTEGEV